MKCCIFLLTLYHGVLYPDDDDDDTVCYLVNVLPCSFYHCLDGERKVWIVSGIFCQLFLIL